MKPGRALCGVIFALVLISGACAAAENAIGDLKAEIEKLRLELKQTQERPVSIANVDRWQSIRFDAGGLRARTAAGKVQIGGLVQVWYQNGGNENNTIRVRRTELRLCMDIHEKVTGYVMMDPARESNESFAPLPTFHVPTMSVTQPQEGTGQVIPHLLQDAYLNFHSVVPHHDFTVGQLKCPAGEEGWRNSGQLEFIERAMITSVRNVRDIGVMMHGTWLDSRVQYWIGAFDSPPGGHQAEPDIAESGNRSDDNNDKDFAWRVSVHPVWNTAAWYGRLELGSHRNTGYRGKDARVDLDSPLNGLNSPRTADIRQGAWAWYRPGNKVRGWWFRGEWGSGHNRSMSSPQYIAAAQGLTPDGTELTMAPVKASGWYFGTGYKISDTIFAEGLRGGDRLHKFLHNLEFAFRYEAYQQIAIENVGQPDQSTAHFNTTACTAGINYYIKGKDAMIQANCIRVNVPGDPKADLHAEHKNVFAVGFQVMF